MHGIGLEKMKVHEGGLAFILELGLDRLFLPLAIAVALVSAGWIAGEIAALRDAAPYMIQRP